MPREPWYKTPDEMQVVIDQYFEDCEGELLRNKEDQPVLNKFGDPVYIRVKPPTITGLALALGFTSRRALLNYEAKKAFVHTVTRAKARVEAYAESRLFDRDGSRGAEFSLRHNFRWAGDDTASGNGILPALLAHMQRNGQAAD